MKIKESVGTRICKSVPQKYVERIEKLLIKHRHCISISQDDVGELPIWSGHVFRQEFESEIPIPCISTSARRRRRNLWFNR